MTSSKADPTGVEIRTTDAVGVKLRAGGQARPTKLFTAAHRLIYRVIDELKPSVIKRLKKAAADHILKN